MADSRITFCITQSYQIFTVQELDWEAPGL